MCLTETLDEMVSNGTLSPELAIQVLVQFDKVRFVHFKFIIFPEKIDSWLCGFFSQILLVNDGGLGDPSEEQGFYQGKDL